MAVSPINKINFIDSITIAKKFEVHLKTKMKNRSWGIEYKAVSMTNRNIIKKIHFVIPWTVISE